MNINMQKCNVCKEISDEDAKGWVRINGASATQMVRPVVMDFCPKCSSTITLSKLPEIANPAPQKPILQAAPAK